MNTVLCKLSSLGINEFRKYSLMNGDIGEIFVHRFYPRIEIFFERVSILSSNFLPIWGQIKVCINDN